ncbi:DNA primase [Arthrobacter phage Racecar]|nr:DNA primase [Arthrobacter phage Racecar]
MKLSDLTGEVKVSTKHSSAFINTWFEPEDKICIVARRSEKVGKYDTLSQSMLAKDFASLNDKMLDSLIFDKDGAKWNLYVGIAPIKEDISLTQRGSEENVAYVPGMYADIDIKPGGFSSQEEIIQFLFSLALTPTIVVGSGSGGVHAYWKLAKGEAGSKELIERWWAYLDETAGERSIDKLFDLTRILRIPGTVYFPKEGSGSKVGAVEILYLTGNTYTVEQVHSISSEAFQIKHEKRKKVIAKDANRRMEMDTLARDLLTKSGKNQWQMWRAISELEDYVNDRIPWSQILLPHGWTHMRTLRDGSNEWARPGRKERSAVVDYEDSPVMSLLSSSPETGLEDLKDAHIPITKYRAMLRLQFEDDEEKMVHYLIGQLESEGII